MQIRMELLTRVPCSYSLGILSADQENFIFQKCFCLFLRLVGRQVSECYELFT